MTAFINPYEEQPYKNPSNKSNTLLIRTPLAKSKPSIYSLPPPTHTYGTMKSADCTNGVNVALHWDKSTTNQNIKHKKNISSNENSNVHNMIHGRASTESINIGDIISNSYQRNAIIQARKSQLLATQNITSKKNTIKHTKSSILHQTANIELQHKDDDTQNKTQFKMKQFRHVQPRVQMPHILAAQGKIKQDAVKQRLQAAAQQQNNDTQAAADEEMQPTDINCDQSIEQ